MFIVCFLVIIIKFFCYLFRFYDIREGEYDFGVFQPPSYCPK